MNFQAPVGTTYFQSRDGSRYYPAADGTFTITEPDDIRDAILAGYSVISGSGSLASAQMITVGANGDFTDLPSAITERNAIGNTLLVDSYAATINGTTGGTLEKHYLIANAGNPLAAIAGNKGDVGVRIKGSGNPIVRGNVINGNTIFLHAPIPKDFTSQLVEIFDIVPVAIVLLPGTHLRMDAALVGTGATGALIPNAFTTFKALVPHTATIEQIGNGTPGKLFGYSNTQNEIYFVDLNLICSKKAINYIFWQLPAIDGADNLQWMCEFGVINCRGNSLSQDLVYYSGTGAGAFIGKHNKFRGTYDVFRLIEHRKVVMFDNDITCYSQGVTNDTGEPTPIVFGSGGAQVYPRQEYFFLENRLESVADALAGDTYGHAAALEIRNNLSSNARVITRNNTLRAVVLGGTDVEGAVGFKVSPNVVMGAEAPYIEVEGNDMYVTNAGTGKATLYDNNDALSVGNYLLRVKNNNILPGSSTLTGVGVYSPSIATYSGTSITPDATTVDAITKMLTADITINNPVNVVPGKIVTFLFKENGTAGHAVTWGSLYQFTTGYVASTVTTDANKFSMIVFMANQNNQLVQISPTNSWSL